MKILKTLKNILTISLIACSTLAGTVTDTVNDYTFKNVTITNNLVVSNQIIAYGNVGIGTNSPSTKLHVTGTITSGDINATGVVTSTVIGSQYMSSDSGNVSMVVTGGGRYATLRFTDLVGWNSWIGANIDSMIFYGPNTGITNILIGGDSRIAIAPTAGNVGIGTTNPAAKLHVAGDTRIDNLLTVYTNIYLSAGTASTMLRLGGNDYEWDVLRDYVDGAKFKIRYLQGDLDVLAIDRAGKVGIGTTNPIQQLHLDGGNELINNGILIITNNADNLLKLASTSAGGPYVWFSHVDSEVGYVGAGGSTGATDPAFTNSMAIRANSGIVFQPANATIQAILTSGGNLGIGTTNPSYRGHIVANATTNVGLMVSGGDTVSSTPNAGSGEIRLGSTPAAQGRWSYNRDSAFMYFDNTYDDDAGNIYFRTKVAGTPVNAMTILGSGKVGIGTSVPAQALNVQNKTVIGTGEAIASPSGAGTAQVGSLRLTSTSNAGLEMGIYAAAPYAAWIQGQNFADMQYFQPLALNPLGGNVGICNNNPQSKLHVNGMVTISSNDSGAYLLLQRTTAITNNSNMGITFQENVVAGDRAKIVAWVDSAGAGQGSLSFHTSDPAAVMKEALRINSAQNVGIGTNAPNFKLHVAASSSGAYTPDARYISTIESSSEAYYNAQVPNNGYAGIRFSNNDATAGSVDYYMGENQLMFIAGGTARMAILGANGNVGIGTTNPVSPLEVNGSLTLANGNQIYTRDGGLVPRRFLSQGTSEWYLNPDATGPISIGGSSVTQTGVGGIAVAGRSKFGDILTVAGNMGVGTTNPSVKFEVAEDVANTGAKFSLYDDDASISTDDLIAGIYAKGRDAGASYPYTGSMIEFHADATWDTTQVTGYKASRIDFYTQENSGTDTLTVPRMTIKSDGKVGIGTNNPSTLLHVVGGIFSSNVIAQNTYIGPLPAVPTYASFMHSNFVNDVTKYSLIQSSAGESYLNGVNSVTLALGNIDKVILTSTGVGIGTNAPVTALDVYSVWSGTPPLKLTGADYWNGITMNSRLNQINNRNWYIGPNGHAYGDFTFDQSSAMYGDPTVSATTRLYIAANGNIGIGTNNPATALHVKTNPDGGEVRITSANTWGALFGYDVNSVQKWLLAYDSTAFLMGSSADVPVALYVNNTEKMRITSAGNVGIGTNAPNDRLVVRGADNSAAMEFGNNNAGGVKFNSIASYDREASAYRDLRLITHAGNNTLVLQAGGNVGIGTIPNAAYRLHVAGGDAGFESNVFISAAANNPVLLQMANGYNNSMGIEFLANGSVANKSIALRMNPSADSSLTFASGPYNANNDLVTGWTDFMTIKASGNVSIGTNVALLGNLVVDGSAANKTNTVLCLSHGGYEAEDDSSTEIILGSKSAAGTHYGTGAKITSREYYASGYGVGLSFWPHNVGAGNTEALTITPAANVGISTTNPATKLDVNGYSTLRGNVTIDQGGADVGIDDWFQKSTYNVRGVIKHGANSGGINSLGGLQIVSQGSGYSINGSGNIIFLNTETNTVSHLADADYKERMRIRYDGNVGISQPTPLAKLHISSEGQNTTKTNLILDFGGIGVGGIEERIGFRNIGSDFGYIGMGTPEAASSYITFANARNTAGYPVEESMRIQPNGNVGINTTGPTAKLEVADANKTPLNLYLGGNVSVFTTNALAADMGGAITLGGVGLTPSTPYGFASLKGGKENGTDGNIDGYLALHTSQAGVGSVEKMRISAAGRVGIGTNAPNYKFEVQSTTAGINSAFKYGQQGLFIYTGSNLAGDSEPTLAALTSSGASGGPLAFGTGVDEWMRITTAGSVGIGTNVPLANLHVVSQPYNGTFRLGGNDASLGILMNYSQGGATLGSMYMNPNYANSSALFSLGTGGNSNQLVLKGNGYVGIGTNDPGYKVHIVSGTSKILLRAETSYSGAQLLSSTDGNDNSEFIVTSPALPTGTQYLLMGMGTNAGKRISTAADYDGYVDTIGTANLLFGVNNSEAMRILWHNKNIGIGTTNPVYLLDAEAKITGNYDVSTHQTVARFYNNPADLGSGVNSAFIQLQTTANGAGHNPIARVGVVGEAYDSNLGSFVVATRDGSGITERMRVTSAGNVAIGTNVADVKLHVKGLAGKDGLVVEALASDAWLRLGHTGAEATIESTYRSYAGYTPMRFYAGGYERLCINTNGNVGIGTNAPASQIPLTLRSPVTSGGQYGVYENGLKIIPSGGSTFIQLATNQAGVHAGGIIYEANYGKGYLNSLNNSECLRIAAPMTSLDQTGVTGAKDGATGLNMRPDGNIGVGTTNPTTLFAVVQTSASDPIADAWTTYPCNRDSKYVVETNTRTNYADAISKIPTYRWKRYAKVSDDEVISALGTTNVISEIDPVLFANKKAQLEDAKSKTPKYQPTRVGIMLDDAEIPAEICTDGDKTRGIDLLAWSGYLHAGLKDEILARKTIQPKTDKLVLTNNVLFVVDEIGTKKQLSPNTNNVMDIRDSNDYVGENRSVDIIKLAQAVEKLSAKLVAAGDNSFTGYTNLLTTTTIPKRDYRQDQKNKAEAYYNLDDIVDLPAMPVFMQAAQTTFDNVHPEWKKDKAIKYKVKTGKPNVLYTSDNGTGGK